MKLSRIIKSLPIFGPLASLIRGEIFYLSNKKILNKNKKYHNAYKGKRCFIVGNGPSLNKHNLKLLQGEYVFTVNSMTITKEFDIIKPAFHVMVDSKRFSYQNKAFLKDFKDLVQEKHRPIYIFPIKSKHFIESIDTKSNLEILYIYQGGPVKAIKKIDLSSKVPPFQNVLNMALYSAIYLGFGKIYLIGFDMTGFIKVYNEDDSYSYGGHFFDKDVKGEKNAMKVVHDGLTNEDFLKKYGYAFELLRMTNDYSENKKIKIYNATKGGTLDMFSRVKYEDLFKKK